MIKGNDKKQLTLFAMPKGHHEKYFDVRSAQGIEVGSVSSISMGACHGQCMISFHIVDSRYMHITSACKNSVTQFFGVAFEIGLRMSGACNFRP